MGFISTISSHNLYLGPGREVTDDEEGCKDRAHAGYPTSHLDQARLLDLALQTKQSSLFEPAGGSRCLNCEELERVCPSLPGAAEKRYPGL